MFKKFLTFYRYRLKFETLLDIFKIQNLVVLVCHHFNFLAGKWRHKMDLKFSIFIFVHLFCSDERRPLNNIKPKKLSKYLISIKRYNCYNVKICYKKKNLCKFHCIISPDWIKISKNFFQFWVCLKIVFQQQTRNL